MHYSYFIILAFTLSYPLFKSFEDKIQFYKKWNSLFPAIIISAILFIAWDIWFTKIGVWSFNPEYLTGFFLLVLPIEEWLFFFITPFSCVFIHEVMIYFVKKDIFANSVKYINTILALGLITTALINHTKIYTLLDFSLLGCFLLIHQYIFKSTYLGRFYLTWLVCMLPFLIVNGFLTYLPIVIYDNLYNLNIRIYCIPIEDLFYGMLNTLLVISIYEYLKQKIK
ncbi:hypothetical protein BH10BAC1_BH10BAC1_21260 [soil metagenome]